MRAYLNKFFLLILILILSGGLVFWLLQKKELQEKRAVHKGVEFVKNSLTDSSDLIHSYPFKALPIRHRLQYVPECLSETMGLWLGVLELADRPVEFDRAFEVLKKYFLLPNGTLTWRVVVEKGQVIQDPESATIDDLRVIRALLLAAERWKRPQYQALAMTLAQSVRETAVYEDYLLRDTLSPDEKDGPLIVNVSYLDVKTMEMIAKIDPAWQPIHRRSLEILEKGTRPNGFIYDNYDVRQKRYYDHDRNMINYLLSAVYLAETGKPTRAFAEFIESQWRSYGKINGAYDPDTAQMEKKFESVAVYALSMRLAFLSGKKELAREIKNYLFYLAAFQRNPLWKNALCDDQCHAFDHLQALSSLAMMAGRQS
jgi:hypothetical protein